jgi:hypothetical protein
MMLTGSEASLPNAVAFGHVHRNELVNFSKLVEQFFNEIKECALISQRALTDLVPARLDNVGALAH